LEIIGKYGTDALRFSLAQNAAPGRDMQLSDESFVSARNFANKIWNASRFITMNLSSVKWEPGYTPVSPPELADTWIISEAGILAKQVTAAYSTYNMDAAARLIYDFFWFKYCDWYIELSKIRLNGPDEDAKKAAISVLIEVLSIVMRLLHPIMPFITEELWQMLSRFLRPQSAAAAASILDASWPGGPDEKKIDTVAMEEMKVLREVIVSVRTIRSEMNVPPGKNITAIINASKDEDIDLVEKYSHYLKFLAKIEDIKIGKGFARPAQSAAAIVSGFEIFVPLHGLIDLVKESQRLKKELENTESEIKRCGQNLGNKDFVKRAPGKEVEKMKARLNDASLKLERLKENLKSLQ